MCCSLAAPSHPKNCVGCFFSFLASLRVFLFLPVSKEICEANTTIMCPMCEDTCEPWTLSDSCVYAKVSVALGLTYKLQSFLLWVCRCVLPAMPWIELSFSYLWNMIILNGYDCLSRQTIAYVEWRRNSNRCTVEVAMIVRAKKKKAKFWANLVQPIFQRSGFPNFCVTMCGICDKDLWEYSQPAACQVRLARAGIPSKLANQQMVICSFYYY